MWHLSHRCDPPARALADRHYNRQSIGADNFVPPGRCLVLKTKPTDAFWVTSWPFKEYVRHAWGGAWMCSAFRREPECPHRASDLILAAVAATRWNWPDVPELGMVTFVNRDKTKPKKDPGYCYLMAGFKPCGETEGGLVALQLTPDAMPRAEMPMGANFSLLGFHGS